MTRGHRGSLLLRCRALSSLTPSRFTRAHCEHVFVSIKGSAYARFRRALETDSAMLATAAAHELPHLSLADALRLCLVYARADRSRFDRAIVRWHARLCLEAKGLDLATAQIALAAATGLAGPHRHESALLLAAIADDHQLTVRGRPGAGRVDSPRRPSATSKRAAPDRGGRVTQSRAGRPSVAGSSPARSV